ncbi:MAG: signal peptide peptidase SppA [Myxococcota bacterium]
MLARLLWLLLVPAAAFAQTAAVFHDDPSRGTTLPPIGAALADEATAIAVNPAGLSFVGAAQLFYAHERAVARNDVVDGLYLGSTFFDLLGAGFSLEWVRSDSSLDYRKTGYALSFGTGTLALGMSYNLFSSAESADLDELTSFDLGISGRVARGFSFGLVARNIDDPSRGAVALRRQYDLGIGVRPFGERYTLGVDYLFDDVAGLDAGRFSYTLKAEVVKGLSIGAGVSHGLRSSDDLFLQVAATIDTSHLGLTYAGGGAPDGLDHVVQVRLSQEKYRSIELDDGQVALLDLAGALSEAQSPTAALLGAREEDPYLRLTRMLHDAERDPDLRGLVVKVDHVDIGFGKAEELRAALERLRLAGKKVIAVLLSADDAEYLAVSGADQLYAVPGANIVVDGLAASSTFLGGTMDKLGVQWDVVRVGAYKNAPDALTRTQMSAEQREAINAYLDTNVRVFSDRVSAARNLSAEKLESAIDEGLKTPKRAKELGLVDDVVAAAELEERLKTLVPGAGFTPSYRPRDVRDLRWGERRKVAIVPVIGNITGGKSRDEPLGVAKVAGVETVIRALARAADDPAVSAIVLRVDSSGGDTLASDLMYRAVLEAKKKKPLVASMGDVAASGGYYVAMGADEVFASPTTITGSIGVFFLKPAVQELGEKLGASQETLTRGELAGMMGFWAPWTQAERAAAQKWVDAFYDEFITEVGKSRNLPKEKVDQVARGRVWSGADAKQRGLVDQLGGLWDAISAAKKRAGIPLGEEIDLPVFGEPGGFFFGTGAHLLAASPPPLPTGLASLAKELGLSEALLLTPSVQARMEYQLVVR